MIVYHGSTQEVKKPDINHSSRNLDFGNGFYVTTVREYDIISGKVANDKVYRVVDMYRRKIWDKERAIQEMRAYESYDQIAFIAQEAIDRMLTYIDSYEVSEND